jgi:hypothetical protein
MSDNLTFGYQVHNKDTDKVRYVWWLKGPKGAIHIWGQYLKEDSFGPDRFYGGIEVHYSSKPYDFAPDEAPIKDCWLTGCDCWPDGSSLFFEEHLKDDVLYHHKGHNVDNYMNLHLEDWYNSKLEGKY